MGKSDWIWVAIRVFGLYLLVLATIAVPDVLSSALKVSSYSTVAHARILTADESVRFDMQQAILVEAIERLFSSLSRVLLYGGIGLYLIRGGELVFRMVFPPHKSAEQPHSS